MPPLAAVAGLLDLFREIAPHFPHTELAKVMSEKGYTPHPAPRPRRYVRWVRNDPQRVTLYQEETGLILDSKRLRNHALKLPHARSRGRRVHFDHEAANIAELAQIVDRISLAAG
jgi:hypothetical protein